METRREGGNKICCYSDSDASARALLKPPRTTARPPFFIKVGDRHKVQKGKKIPGMGFTSMDCFHLYLIKRQLERQSGGGFFGNILFVVKFPSC